MCTLRYEKIPSTRPGAQLNVLVCLPEGRPPNHNQLLLR